MSSSRQHQRPMLPELPVEIWLRIVSYLSPKDFLRLSPLNRFFREIVRNYRYENLVLRCFTDDMMDMLKNARIPMIAQRIHSLEIQLQEFVWLVDFDKAYPPHRWPTTLKSPLTFLRSRMTNRAIQKDSNPMLMMSRTVTQITNYLLTAAPEMVHLHSCHFGFLPSGALEPYIPFLLKFWSIIAPRVRRLTIEALGSQMHLLSSVFCHVDHLEHLSISVVQREFPQPVWNMATAWDVSLAAFLNNASGTLQSLTLTSSSQSVTPEYRSIFDQLTRFKQLKRFNLEFFLDGIVSPSVIQFLNKNADTIREISLNLDTSRDLPLTPLSSLIIPSLQRLHISFSSDRYIWTGTTFWEGHLRFSMLRHLSVDSLHNFRMDFTLIFSAFRRSGSGAMLDTLKLGGCALTVPLFDSMVETFPVLRVLSICVYMCHHPKTDTLAIQHFSEQMSMRNYPQWGLYDISLLHPSQGYTLHSTMEVVARSIPSIQSFCGTGNKERVRGVHGLDVDFLLQSRGFQ